MLSYNFESGIGALTRCEYVHAQYRLVIVIDYDQHALLVHWDGNLNAHQLNPQCKLCMFEHKEESSTRHRPVSMVSSQSLNRLRAKLNSTLAWLSVNRRVGNMH